VHMFSLGVAVAVSLIPEGLPIVITLILATGVFRMSKRNALVKKLQAVEALGQANIIAVDKTGTITRNALMVEVLLIDGKEFRVSGNGYSLDGDIVYGDQPVVPSNHEELRLLGKIAAFCANARLWYQEKEKKWKVGGDPTEAALLVIGGKLGFNKDDLEEEEPQILEVPFSNDSKYHETVHRNRNGELFLTTVGAPENILALCDTFWKEGATERLTHVYLERLRDDIERLSKGGLRILAAAYKTYHAGAVIPADHPHGLTFAGFFGMRDSLRDGVADSVRQAEENGIRVIMITGDYKTTAMAIAKDAGIYSEGDEVITGEELEAMSDVGLQSKLDNVSVFARVTAEHKLKIIELFKGRGEIIAMTGDGVNDALPLVAADLGIAMGKGGTEVAKEAADIVLLDDNFESIIAAVEEGRSIFSSIRKVLLYLFSTGIGEMLVVMGALFLLLPLPLLPTQIIWLNLVTDGFLVIALAMEPREMLTRKNGSRALVDRFLFMRMLFLGLVMALGTLFIFVFFEGSDFTRASTMALTTLAIFQWFNAWNVRSSKRSIFTSNPFGNPYLVGATVLVVLLQMLAIYHPFFQEVLKTVPLSRSDLYIAIGVATSVVLVEEIRKLFASLLRH
ncbi:MAG: HAD-IC family P-type ATPase, partial [bacterium]|nr:HAD-IC family P-type ATPase [bacterium]